MNADTIRQLIEQGLPGARAQVQGEDGVHFEATVVARPSAASCRWPATAWSTPRSASAWAARSTPWR